MQWIKDLSEPKTMGYYFIKFLDIEDDEISKDVAEFIPGFAWPVPDGCEVVEWLDESQPQKEEVNEDEFSILLALGNELLEAEKLSFSDRHKVKVEILKNYSITRKH